MTTANGTRSALSGLLFLAAVNEAMQTYGTLNSSPQTTELFASTRERTLMKWVRIGDISALAIGLFASWIGRSGWPLVGTSLVVVGMHTAYVHAAAAGKGETPPATSNGKPTKGGRYGFVS